MKKFTCKSFAILSAWLLSCCFAFAQTPGDPVWQLVTPKYGDHEAIVAGYVLEASQFGNGATDATSYIQACLDKLDTYTGETRYGGGVVYLKEGRYKISGRLKIPKGITLRGDWEKPVKGQAIKGTILEAYYGQNLDLAADGSCDNGNTSNSFISMVSGSAVMDLAVWYPEQSATAPKSYPPTIQMGATNTWEPGFYNVKNVTLVNSYYGIIFYKSGETCPTINGVYGTPLKQGVEIDWIVDIGRIENCDFSPKYWAGSGLPGSPSITNTTYTDWIYNNGTGVVMRRNDWSYTCYLKVEGYNKGFHAVRSRGAAANSPNGHNYGFNFTNCKYGLYFDSGAGEGCMFTEVKTAGCEFGAYFAETAAGVAQFYKWDLSATKCALFTDKNASTKITMMESTIRAGKTLLQGGTLVAVNNDFNNPQPQIEFEANSRGDIIGNRFSQGVQISEGSVFQNNINHAAVAMEPLHAYYEFVPQFKKPTRYTLYNVLNAPYNVTKGTINAIPGADATTGIQAALNAASSAGGGVVYLPPGHYRINGQLSIPSNVELKGSMDISAFPMGPGSVLEIYNTTTPAVIMQANSGIRGIDFNYPDQVLCTVMPDPIDYPFTIQGNGNNIHIVNVAMRAASRGVDFATNRCDNFYIDFLTGYFFREGVNVKNSANGVLANMQCNTIVYNAGEQEKYGKYPNSNRGDCEPLGAKSPYFYNSENLTFLTLENVDNILMYNDFNYNANIGIHVKNNVNGLALGFALDDDRTGLLLDGSNIQLDFINLQCVALQRDANDNSHSNYGEPSSYIKSTTNYTADSQVNLFNSDYWGYAGESGIVLDGAGTVNMYGGNFMHSGANSFADVDNGNLNVVGSVVNPANNNNPTYTGNTTGNINTIGSIIGGNATGDTNIAHSPTASTSGALNDCNTWTATASYTNSGDAQNMVNCDPAGRWNSGWQNQGQGQNAVTIVVDMKSNQTFNQVILDYGSAPTDGPQTYTLEVSTNGSQYTPVASGNGNSSAMTMISFDTQTARYIRLIKPQSTKGNFFAIDKFYVANIANTDVDGITAIPDGTPGIDEGEEPVAVTGVTMENVSVAEGGNTILMPVILPSDATNRDVTFAIVNGGDNISLNTATGLVTGIATGTATVRVTTADGSFTADATITITAAPAQTCDPIRTIRIKTYGTDTKPAKYLQDNNGTLTWSDVQNTTSEWYEIPVDGSTTDFYLKNVSTQKYIYRPGTKTAVDGDWGYEVAALGATNQETALYQFRATETIWDGKSYLVNVANADFENVSNKGAFVLNPGNYNHNIPTWNDGTPVIIGGMPDNTNVWVSVELNTVQASVDNPDCKTPDCGITISAQPQSASYTVGDVTSALTVTVSGSNLSYIWYKSTDNSNETPANDTQVGTATTYIPDATIAGTFYYYATISNGDCSVASNVATISVTTSGATGPTYPAGYPKTMAMQNPLFWQFGSEKVTDDDAGTLIPGSKGNLYTADPSAHVWNINGVETLFVYASHDMEAPRGCDRMDRYHVYSTTDMVNWTDYGEIIKAADVPWSKNNTFINGSTFMWAPDAAYKNGKYYFYFPHPSQNSDNGAGSWGNNWKIGIAVSDHPASDFTILDNPLALSTGFEYDPCVFVDDDGQAYLYYGGGANPYVVKLKENMIEIDGTPQVMQGLNNFHEGIWVHKYNGKYYLSYPDNGGGGDGNGDQLKYAVSDSPTGPWESIGAYVYATGCGTIHGSIVEFKNQWYAFYHSDYVSHNGDQGRSVHVDKLYYNPDGTIQLVNNFGQAYKGPHNVVETTNTAQIALTLQAEDFNTGGETYGYHDTRNYEANPQGNSYRTDATGISIESRAGGVYNIGDIARREFLRYTITVDKVGLYDVDCYVASGNNDGRFHLNVNGVNKSGEVAVTGNGGWGDDGFAKLTVPNIPLKAGENLFELRVRNGGFNIDRFEFRAAQAYAGTPYKGPHNIFDGAVLEAEDFDNGGQGVAYHDNSPTENEGEYDYRNNTDGIGVDIQQQGDGRINISHTGSGEWLKYTINVTQAGTYDIIMPVSTGNGSAALSLTIDDVIEYPLVSINTLGWDNYLDLTVKGVELTAGIHTLTLNFGGGINVDKFTFGLNSAQVPAQPSLISGNTTTCKGTTGLTYSVTNVADVNYTWTVPTEWDITNGQGTNSITVNATNTAIAGNITVTPSNNQGNGPARTLAVTVSDVPAQPSTIAGDASVCKGKAGLTYSVTAVAGVTYTWDVPTGWNITNGQNTNTITLTATTAAIDGNISVIPNNSCGNGTPSTLPVTVNDVPAQPGAISGTDVICKGETGLSYSVANVAGVTYTWTVPTGWTIEDGQGTNTIEVSSAAAISGTISVEPTNSCGKGTARTLAVTVNDIPAQPGTITGNASPCKETTGLIYTVAAVAGVTYTWDVPNGWNITNGQGTNSVTVTATTSAANGNISVTPTNLCGDGPDVTLAVTISSLPAQPSAITGNATVCKNKTGITYSVTNVTGVTYNWTVPTGWTITTGNNTSSITVNTTNATSGTITVKASNDCGNSAESMLDVTVNEIPAKPGTITGDANPCKGTTGLIYSVPAVTGATSYTWTVPTGWTITNGNNTNSITVTATTGATNGNITVKATNSCGSSAESTLAVTGNNGAPAQPSTITGNTTVCKNKTGITYSVTNVTGVTYNWTVPTGWTITTGNGTNAITVSTDASAVAGDIEVTPNNGCGNGTSRTLAVTVNDVPDQPSAINGNNVICKGDGLTYSVTNVSGLTYTWDVPTGWDITGSSNTNSITVNTTNATSGTITVKATNDCGNSTESTLTVTVNEIPAKPGTITGDTNPCKGTTGLIYSVPAVTGATSYTWTVPSGWTITNGNNTNSITVTATTEATNGNIIVKATNSCGSSAESTLAVTGNNGAPAQPSTITGNATVCKNTTGITYSVTNVAGVTYTWDVPTGWNITAGQNTNSITVTATSTAASGNIEVIPSNGCGNGATRTLAVTANDIPTHPGTISGPVSVAKGTNGLTYSVTNVPGTTYTWTVPAGWTIAAGNNTNSITVEAGTAAISGSITVTPNNGSCTGTAASVDVTVTVAVDGISIDNNISVNKGETKTLNHTITPSDATNKNVTYNIISGHGCIEIDHENGTITGLTAGTVVLQITTEDGGKSTTCTITVADDGGVGVGVVTGDERSIIAYDNVVQVNGLSEGEVITVYNLVGATMHTQRADQKTEYIYGLKPGMYTVIIEGTGVIQKVLISK